MAEGAIRLGGLPSLMIEGSAQWVSVSWEEQGSNELHLLGSAVPEAMSSSIKGFLEALRAGSVRPDYSEWVLSLSNPARPLEGKPGPGEGEVTLLWQTARDGTPGVEQMVPMSELEQWPNALDQYGPADPDEVRRPSVYDR